MTTTLYTSLTPPVDPLDSRRAEYIENRLSEVLFDTLKHVFPDTLSRKEHLTVPERLLLILFKSFGSFFKIWEFGTRKYLSIKDTCRSGQIKTLELCIKHEVRFYV